MLLTAPSPCPLSYCAVYQTALLEFSTAVITTHAWIRMHLAAICVIIWQYPGSVCFFLFFFSPELLKYEFHSKKLKNFYYTWTKHQSEILPLWCIPPPAELQLNLNWTVGFWGLHRSWARAEQRKEWICGFWFSSMDWLKTSISSRVSLAWRLQVLGSAGQCSTSIGPSPHASVWHKPFPLPRIILYCSTGVRRGSVLHGGFKCLHRQSSEADLCLPLLSVSLFFLVTFLSRSALAGSPQGSVFKPEHLRCVCAGPDSQGCFCCTFWFLTRALATLACLLCSDFFLQHARFTVMKW